MPDTNLTRPLISSLSFGDALAVHLNGQLINTTDLGTFTGAIIPNNPTVKGAIQSLETSVETSVASLQAHKAFCTATQGGAIGGTGVQVEVCWANLIVPVGGAVVKFTATMGCGPAGGGALWNTHFEVDNNGALLGIMSFDANPLTVNFTNTTYATLAAGTHRISLYWYGQNGNIGIGGVSPATLIAEVLG